MSADKDIEMIMEELDVYDKRLDTIRHYVRSRRLLKGKRLQKELDKAFGSVYDRNFVPGSLVLYQSDRLCVGLLKIEEKDNKKIPHLRGNIAIDLFSAA